MTDELFSRKTVQPLIKNKGLEDTSPFVATLDKEKISVGQRLREILRVQKVVNEITGTDEWIEYQHTKLDRE